MKLNYKEYKDKVYACWLGKNIGGTMGAPYEGIREILDIKGFATQPGVVIPNDDLDLQLIWLYALENVGPHGINAAVLGEHWISFIVPHWNEYGIGKANMKRGLPPPMSGDYENDWQHSNGAWIRSEIWATVCPAMPHIAAKYAMEDAMVDHGSGEGTFAAAFVAALQSAAFAISELKKCIEIGLAAIPEESRMAKSIKFVLECYEKGMSWSDARNAVQQLNADIGNGWFEAPSNVTYAVIGLLWGEGDFKKSMITAINCGDDTDCTGATVGATMGILYGTAGVPRDWSEYIGDDIVTVSIAKGNNGKNVPKTCTELTDRVVRLAPVVVGAHSIRHSNWMYSGELLPGYTVDFCDETETEGVYENLMSLAAKAGVVAKSLKPYTVYAENVMYNVSLTLDREPTVKAGDEIGVSVYIQSKQYFEDEPRTVEARWLLPEGFTVSGKRTVMTKAFNPHTHGEGEMHFTIQVGENVAAENRMVLELFANGRCTPLYVYFPLYA